ncbi:hypothetical protein F0562_003831 [Nyssa sinensis]|uniref:Hexosyltransferase n=1 Tax=Nyssa sinensis TaxID=561372 RepID=A0A5J5BW80_9ASTE|nr:hypothetical protein F0562_003831 [Nyssa sinensis]
MPPTSGAPWPPFSPSSNTPPAPKTSTSTSLPPLPPTSTTSTPPLQILSLICDSESTASMTLLWPGLISTSIRAALDCPLNYARNYLADLLPTCVSKAVYLDSDLVLVGDIAELAATPLGDQAVLAAPEYCNANFTSYFTPTFWSNPSLSLTFAGRNACYFNTGVMVIDLERWRAGDYTRKIVEWMELQKRMRIYELGSLPPFLLVFAGNIAPVDHRWNQHGLGGDNFRGLCRDLHPGPVSLLHWSGKAETKQRPKVTDLALMCLLFYDKDDLVSGGCV